MFSFVYLFIFNYTHIQIILFIARDAEEVKEKNNIEEKIACR
mgnify:CR=1 FL=1